MKLNGAIVNFLGDSITEGVGASCEGNRYTDVLAREFGLARANNYGVSGSRIARQTVMTNEPHDRDFCMRMAEMDENADAVVVFGGTNDYGHGDAPLGVPSDRTPFTFWGACHWLMDGLLTRYAGKPVVIRAQAAERRAAVRLSGHPAGNGAALRSAGAGSVRRQRHPAGKCTLPGAALARRPSSQRRRACVAGQKARAVFANAVREMRK